MVDEFHLEGQVVGLGIDRIDYTKGIPHRLKAIGRFFEKYPAYCGKVVFVQAGVMSRSNIDAYRLLGEQIDLELDVVNSRFSRAGWQPIIYLPTDLPNVTLMCAESHLATQAGLGHQRVAGLLPQLQGADQIQTTVHQLLWRHGSSPVG